MSHFPQYIYFLINWHFLKTLFNYLLFSLYSSTGSRHLKAIPLHQRFNSLVEINRNETLDQLIKGSILEPCGVVGTTFPNDVSTYNI